MSTPCSRPVVAEFESEHRVPERLVRVSRQSGRLRPQRECALMNPVLGRTRHRRGSVLPAPQSPNSAVGHLASQRIRYRLRRSACDVEAVVIEHVDQIDDGGLAVLKQVKCEHAAQLVATQTSPCRHDRTVPDQTDIKCASPAIERSDVDGLALPAFGRQSRARLAGLSSGDNVAARRATPRVLGTLVCDLEPRSQAVASGLRASARRIAPIGSA